MTLKGLPRVRVVNSQLAKLAEKTFEEALAALNSEDFESAEQLFSQAQDMYKSIGNFTKVSECQNYIERCNQYLEEEQLKVIKAEVLFKKEYLALNSNVRRG